MFIPASDTVPDGQVRAENARDSGNAAPASLACRCGFTGDIDCLGQHLIAVFTPADRVGLHGEEHAPPEPAGEQA